MTSTRLHTHKKSHTQHTSFLCDLVKNVETAYKSKNKHMNDMKNNLVQSKTDSL